MPRTEARVFTSIWSDPDFRPLSALAKSAYLFLVSQPDLTHCGVIPLRPARWAAKLGILPADMESGVAELSDAMFTIPDSDTGELLVRSLTRRDRVLRSPKMWVPFSKSVADVESMRILSVLLAEITRVQAEGDVNPTLERGVEALVARLERHLDCLPASLSDTQSARHLASLPDTRPPGLSGSHPDTLQGEGARNGSNQRSPLPPEKRPLPPAPRRDDGADDSAPTSAQVRAGEGDETGNGKPAGRDVDALAAEVRKLRPEWSSRSVKRAVTAPAAAERPWPVVRLAMLAVAADPDSQAPGRLAGDGPWWHQRPAKPAPPPRPPWCGKCDPENRQRDTDDGPARCRDCHPLYEETTP